MDCFPSMPFQGAGGLPGPRGRPGTNGALVGSTSPSLFSQHAETMRWRLLVLTLVHSQRDSCRNHSPPYCTRGLCSFVREHVLSGPRGLLHFQLRSALEAFLSKQPSTGSSRRFKVYGSYRTNLCQPVKWVVCKVGY